MTTSLGDPYPPCYEGIPPGMTKCDLYLWRKFQALHCIGWTQVYFNVRVGKGSPAPESYEENIRDGWMSLTQNRIDALIETHKEVMIVETRRKAGRSAFGGLILYKQLWDKDPKIDKPVSMVIVTDYLTTQMEESFKENGIKIYLV